MAKGIFFIIALAGFMGSLIVHLAILLETEPPALFAPLYPLLPAGLALSFVSIFLFQLTGKGHGQEKADRTSEKIPWWQGIFRGIFMLYFFFNFGLLAYVTADGTPAGVGEGRYAMTERGKTLRHLTAEEYEVAERRYRKTTGQVLTGAMLLFYGAAVLFFVPVKARPSTPRR